MAGLKWALLGIVAAASPMTARAEVFAWLQYGIAGLEARATSDAPACPRATIDGAEVQLQLRAAPNGNFPVVTCAVSVPSGAKTLTIDGKTLPLPDRAPKRIAVIGDTGCRLKGIYIQACNDPEQWPFARIAEAVAAQQPDLIIHVGDYHYRETACPPVISGCAGSPVGDTWAVWRADFFAPAAPLLPAAPWVFVRGNHEECDRGGQGWSRTLEPYPFDDSRGCNRPAAPFFVRLPAMTLAIVDTSSATEHKISATEAASFRAQYTALANVAPAPVWLLQHRPIWSAGGTVAGFPFGDNKTLAAAAAGTLPPNVDMMLSGHHHIFQVLTYADDLPLQVIAGHGGDYLNPGQSHNPAGWVLNGVTVKSGIHETGAFGFVMLEAADDSWLLTNRDRAGAVKQRCTLKGREAACTGDK